MRLWVTIIALLAACTAAAATAKLTPRGSAWLRVAPAAVGLDPAKLDQIAADAERGKSNCLVVVRDSKLAGEWYFRGTGPNTSQDVFSVTKSVASTLVGIAQDDGDLRIGASASRWIPEWRKAPASAVTIRNLLSNDSGREWDLLTDYVGLLRARDSTAFGIRLRQTAAPGTVWAYNNSAVQTLEQVLQRATGDDVATFAQKHLFAPLGMTRTTMTRDRAGNPQLFEGLRSTCRDLARFGLLMLNRGRRGARQIVSAAWVREATGRPSTKLNASYGYLWWLNRRGIVASPLAGTTVGRARSVVGRLVPGAPAAMYWALGLGNQLIQIDPGSKTVVVRLGTAEPIPTPPTFGAVEASTIVTQAIRSR